MGGKAINVQKALDLYTSGLTLKQVAKIVGSSPAGICSYTAAAGLSRVAPSDPKERLLRQRNISESGCWEWTGAKTWAGYGRLTFNYRSLAAHRLAASVWLGFNLNSKECVLHKCDNPACFNPKHLYTGTQADNIKDMWRRGRARVGGRKHAATS